MPKIVAVWIDESVNGLSVLVLRGQHYKRFKNISYATFAKLLIAMRNTGLKQYDSVNFENTTRYVYWRPF